MCEDVADGGTFYIQSNSSFCVNCPISGSVQWLIDLVLLVDINPALDYMVLSNNSLLMQSSVEGGYQCRSTTNTLNNHQFRVFLASKSCCVRCRVILMNCCIYLVDNPPFINDPTVYNESVSVNINCLFNVRPSPRGVVWQRNNVTISNTALLSFNSIQQSDAGLYTCIFREVAGETVTTCNDFTLTVQCELFICYTHYKTFLLQMLIYSYSYQEYSCRYV